HVAGHAVLAILLQALAVLLAELGRRLDVRLELLEIGDALLHRAEALAAVTREGREGGHERLAELRGVRVGGVLPEGVVGVWGRGRRVRRVRRVRRTGGRHLPADGGEHLRLLLDGERLEGSDDLVGIHGLDLRTVVREAEAVSLVATTLPGTVA